jgi:Kef-type K+ transport system membrane component KefB
MSDNPVFTYRAGFRRVAQAVQKWLMLGGLFLLFACGLASVIARTTDNLRALLIAGSLAGAIALIGGIVWGLYWRRKLRAEFRKEFGPK